MTINLHADISAGFIKDIIEALPPLLHPKWTIYRYPFGEHDFETEFCLCNRDYRLHFNFWASCGRDDIEIIIGESEGSPDMPRDNRGDTKLFRRAFSDPRCFEKIMESILKWLHRHEQEHGVQIVKSP